MGPNPPPEIRVNPAVSTPRPVSADRAALVIALVAAFGGWLIAVGTAVGQRLSDPSVLDDSACRVVAAPQAGAAAPLAEPLASRCRGTL
jgi:hypothetical protein